MPSLPKPTAENPWPVRVVAQSLSEYIGRLGTMWVEGEVTQVSRRPGVKTAFITLRDTATAMSLQVTCGTPLLDSAAVPIGEGARVILRGNFEYFAGRGSLSLRALEIRPVGLGDLLARIARLREVLRAEGLFDPRLKRPLPYLPRRVGLITGRASAAEKDVVEVSRRRWPQVRFEVRTTAVQGPNAVAEVVAALTELDADEAVDVIIIARGGGSVEDLLPFSDETLCRAVAKATTPVVSAIGHEPDSPLLDHVADLRAATPTDAAKLVVPDVVAERQLLTELRGRARAALHGWVDRERNSLAQLRSRPVLADPNRILGEHRRVIEQSRRTARRDIEHLIGSEQHRVAALRARWETLGPAATLARGYAVVQRVSAGTDGDPHAEVVDSVSQIQIGSQLRIRVADGAARAAVLEVEEHK